MSNLNEITSLIEATQQTKSDRLVKAEELGSLLFVDNEIAEFDDIYDYNTVGTKVKAEFLAKPEWDEQLHQMFPETYEKWFNLYEREEAIGGCGEWGVYMALKASGIKNVTQSMIREFGYAQGYGSANSVNYSFLRLFLKPQLGVHEQINTKLIDIEVALEKGNVILANWYDGEGHYSIIGGISEDQKQLLIVDGYPGRTGLYKVDTQTFMNDLFFDTTDYEGAEGEFLNGYCMIVDPKHTKPGIKIRSANEILDDSINTAISTF